MFLRNKWWAIAESNTIRNKPVGLRRLGEDIVLWRNQEGKIICQRSQCPHRGANLALGRVVDGCIECPYHGFRFATQGHCTLMPCEGKDTHISPEMRVKTYVVREAHDLIWLWWGDNQLDYPSIPWFDELRDRPVRWASGTMQWNVPYTRAVESLLIDIHHAAFVHQGFAKLSGFGSATLLDPFEVKLDGEMISSWGQLRPETANSTQKGVFTFQHWLYFPSLALFDFGFGGIKLFAIAIPIDEENTWAYARYYIPFGTAWISRLLSRVALWLEFTFIQPDDYRIILSSKPRQSGLNANKFVRADKVIVLWHKLYENYESRANTE
ncbi:MAG: aromatic ring-hydroxylating dioxygenase subunit alpha [Scytonema sp. PMC 1069.18]|nr:aromatic ring-hydroxylating dioxygenase subunit alpha [Scytonema sp. PMC 1069.18]MEC4880098.1 aromatic ring-hydroxylating dioxygenase subunit alpha [Scytonema sp. PMC 1070.18]